MDLALAAGLIGLEMTDQRFPAALTEAARQKVRIVFAVSALRESRHPNTLHLDLHGRNGTRLRAVACSTGGGAFVFKRIEGWPVNLDGKAHLLLGLGTKQAVAQLRRLLRQCLSQPALLRVQRRSDEALLLAEFVAPLPAPVRRRCAALPGIRWLRSVEPIFYPQQGEPLFAGAGQLVALAEQKGWSLGQAGLAYESALLGVPEKRIQTEIGRRYGIMRRAAQRGLREEGISLTLLQPSAAKVWRANQRGNLAAGGMHARAAARALAVMHVSNSGGIVCAAPTGGSAGTLPAVIITLAEEMRLGMDGIRRALMAAGAIGLVVAQRSTFAAEVAGCQVEIGAAGAMAAAAVVEAAGGTARQACAAAAIAFQNTMGSVCDLVQGMCEIPCHTRNAVAAAAAFVCADLILGGYENPIPLDDTVDAVHGVGRMLPRELRCTALGGLALAPAAQKLHRLK